MEEYNKYINALKGHHKDVDFSLMLSQIEARSLKSADSSALWLKFAASGAVAALIIGFLAFNVAISRFSGGNYLSDYVFDNSAVDEDPVMAYVFSK